MLPKPTNYQVRPVIYPADTESEVTVLPSERAFLLCEGEDYTVTVVGIDLDVANRNDLSNRCEYHAKSSGGVLRFKHTFGGEQEHLIILSKEDVTLAKLSVYSLYQDLYELTPLRGDLHVHSFRSDGKRDPSALLGHFREQGYDFATLSDHNRYYPGGEIDETYAGVRLGITHIQGEEVHVPETPVHLVAVGGKKSVCEQYIENSPAYQAEMASYKAQVPQSVPARYAERYAIARWVCDKTHDANGLCIFPHPCWRPANSISMNVCDELANIFLRSGMFDAFEVIGGISASGNNRQVALWTDLLSEGVKIPVVGSSDVHGIQASHCFPNHFTVCFAKSNSEGDILNAVRAGDCVAVEAQGVEYDRVYRAYGSLRLVSYAQFLLTHYFPLLQRIAQSEGIVMREYAMGNADKALLECLVDQTERFKQVFFGRRSPMLPNKDILDFETRWRERHLQGPVTKGSTLHSDKITRQI